MTSQHNSMLQIASGRDRERVRAEAERILLTYGIRISDLPDDQVRIDVARTIEGRSEWTIWVRRDALEAVGADLPDRSSSSTLRPSE